MRMNPHYTTQLSQAINAASARQQSLTSELSSGLRVSSLSVDPAAAAGNVQTANTISRIDTFVHSAATVQGRLQVADTTLGDVVTQITSALSLAVSAGNGTLSAADLSAITAQVVTIRDNVLTSANATYQGQYLFAGSQGSTPPFTLDSTTDPATATYHGDSATQTLTTPGGQSLTTNLTGTQVFQASGSDLLATLNQLVSHLQSGTTSAIAGDTAALTNALGNVSSQRAALDSNLKRLSDTTTYVSTQEAALKSAQNTLLAADPAQVATDLKSSEVQYEALLSVVSVLNKTNLFDYLR